MAAEFPVEIKTLGGFGVLRELQPVKSKTSIYERIL
jgi:hypothetical protein